MKGEVGYTGVDTILLPHELHKQVSSRNIVVSTQPGLPTFRRRRFPMEAHPQVQQLPRNTRLWVAGR